MEGFRATDDRRVLRSKIWQQTCLGRPGNADTAADQVAHITLTLQRMIAKTGITGHQFRTTVITMLAQTDAKESHSRAIVGHQVGTQDVHEKSFVKLRTPITLQATVEMIDWDNWVWSEYW